MARKSSAVGVSGSTRSSVEILLVENVEHVGEQGDIVRVKPGYARNFLLPQGLATVATEHNKKMVELHKIKVAEVEVSRIKDLKSLAEAVSKYSVTIEANAKPDSQLYGSIVAVDISKALKTAGFAVKEKHIKLEGPLKELGMYTVKVQLHSKVETEVKVWVVPTAK
jgi:large subunit ribosomal protein L9